jgi:hypothetical protein
MDEKRFRFDLFIALCALLVSGIAAGASAYQTYVINQQYQASVWPYLRFSFSSGDAELTLAVENYGLGPALIRSFEITKDGKPVTSLEPYVIALETANEHATVATEELGPGSVLPAAETAPLLSVKNGPRMVKALLAHQASLDVLICYCSLLGRCWLQDMQDSSVQPRDVTFCPLPRVAQPRMFGIQPTTPKPSASAPPLSTSPSPRTQSPGS